MSRRVLVGAVGAALAAGLLTSAVAQAEPLVELEWSAPEGCPQREEVLRDVARLVANAPAEPLVVRAAVTEAADGTWRVELALSGAAEGARTLSAGACRTVGRAAALVIALSIDPQAASVASEAMLAEEAVLTEPTPPPPEPPAPAAPLPAPPSRAPPSAPASSPAERVRATAFAGVVAEQALLPRVAAGGVLGGGVAGRGLRADAAVAFVPRAHAELERDASLGADFQLVWLALGACGGPDGTHFEIAVCASVRGNLLRGTGTGAPEIATLSAFVPSVAPGVRVAVPGLGRSAVELTVDATVPLLRPHFAIADDLTGTQWTVFRPPAVGLTAALVFALRP